MELRRCTDALLRSQPTSLSSLFSSPAITRWQSLGRPLTQRQVSARLFSSSQTYATGSWATPTRPLRNTPTSTTTTSSSSPPKSDELRTLTEGLWGAPQPTPTPSTFGVRPSLSQEQERRLNDGNSAADILRTINKIKSAPIPSSATQRAKDLQIGRMDMPTSNRPDILGISELMNEAAPTPPVKPLRLVPAAGRTIHVSDRVDLTTAIRKVEILCARNSVRRDFTAQRFHERPGLKRKRLRRERWRKNFKESFKATIARVQELKKQGW